MSSEHLTREASPRANEGPSAHSSRARGRTSAPRSSNWLLPAAKVAGAVLAAAVLAIVGASAGARSPGAVEEAPQGAFSAPSQAPPSLAAAPSSGPSDPPTVGTVATDAGAGAPAGAGVTADGRIILNAAGEEDLTKLPGIGPSRARAIVALRQRLAKFRAVEDLLRVKGIGRKTLRRIKPNVVLDRPPGADAGAAPPVE